MSVVLSQDFFAGIFAAFAASGVTKFPVNDAFHQAMEAAFNLLLEKSGELDVRFRIRRHPIHGDSETVREGVFSAAASGMLVLEGPSFTTARLTMSEGFPEALLASLPGGRALYDELASAFFESRSWA